MEVYGFASQAGIVVTLNRQKYDVAGNLLRK
jgi:hypothetical protein